MAYSTAVFFAAAGVLHVSAAADHTGLPVMLAGFVAVATLQVGFAGVLLWRRPDPLLLVGATALTVLAIGIWVVSRTRGLPFTEGGHEEPMGFKDAVTVLFELACLPGLLLLGSRELSQVRLPSGRLGSSTVAGLAAAAFALSVPALVLGGGDHHSGAEHAEAGHSHGKGQGSGGDPAEGTELASAAKGAHHRRGSDGAGAGAAPRDEGERSHGHARDRQAGGAGAGHGAGQGSGHGDGDQRAGGHEDGAAGEPGGGERHRTRGGREGAHPRGGRGGRERSEHGQDGHGKTGKRKGKGNHGKGGHGETSPEHGGHGEEPAGPPALFPPGEPLQRLCNDGGLCIP